MGPVVADTHTISWYILEPGILSTKALVALTEAENAGLPIYLPSISIVEICYLVEKGRLTETVLERILSAVDDPEAAVVITPLDSAVALAIRDIPRDLVPDMPDRIIAATALHLGLSLVTRDSKIQACGIPTIW